MADPIEIAKVGVEAFGTADWDRVRAALTPDSVYEEFATGRRIVGPDSIIEADKGWKQAFPDARGTIRTAVASGSTVTLEITWEGTHTGDLVGPQGTIPASGRPVSLPAAQVVEVEGDKAKATRHYFDLMTLMAQIGAVPAGG